MKQKVLDEVSKERERQDQKWGEQNHAPFAYLSILMEEVGEAAQAANDAHVWGHGTDTRHWERVRLEHLRNELVQVAAVAVAMIECLDRGKWYAESGSMGRFAEEV